MPLQKTEAIVLRSLKQGETSKILTLYTRAFGKIKVIAKGARSSRSRFGGSLEPLNYISIVFYEKENRDLQTLSQADIVEAYLRINSDLIKTTLAMAACELLDRIEFGVAPNPQMFQLLVQVLRALNDASNGKANCFRAYQLRMCDLLGIKPNLGSCLQCGRTHDGRVRFDLSRGRYICEGCAQSSTPGILLAAESVEVLRELSVAPISKLNGLLASSSAEQQVDRFLDAYLKYHVDGLRDLKSLSFLKKVT